jgi:hypothetical protein
MLPSAGSVSDINQVQQQDLVNYDQTDELNGEGVLIEKE